jgi:hypothetical protein
MAMVPQPDYVSNRPGATRVIPHFRGFVAPHFCGLLEVRRKKPRYPLETSMKLIFTLLLLLPVSACVVAPNGGGGNGGGETAVVCHKGKKTLELPLDAAQAHLNHGDRRGPC